MTARMHGWYFDHDLRPFARALALVGSLGCGHTAAVEPSPAATTTQASSGAERAAPAKRLPLQAPLLRRVLRSAK